ncbi:hypothetical protein CQW23_29794 [Capsicum baccatum]|uniref:Uncharacterized protein n=1 Tax=Capsicum baccatum TaxID=33114 RepID=A0A2G2VCA1_CAPBA|nr:hypothetical protein CQW23_29794 [Capsicum baccatum]
MPLSPVDNLHRRLFLLHHTRRQLLPQVFDWNSRFAKKLFRKKLLYPAFLKQASKKFGGDEEQPKLRLIVDENYGGFPNAKNNGMTNTRMSGNKPQKASASETWINMADKFVARPGGSDIEDMDFQMAKIKSSEQEDKVLPESVDFVDDEPLFPGPDRDLSDCET